MFQENKRWIFISVLGLGTLLFGWFLASGVSISKQIQARLLTDQEAPLPLTSEKAKVTYDLNTSLYLGNISQMKTYKAQSIGYTEEQAGQYAKAFQIEAPMEEREDHYYFEDQGEELKVGKKIGVIEYKNQKMAMEEKVDIYSEPELVEKAVEWIKSKNLNIEHVKAIIHHEKVENQYTVYFINTIGGFHNYSHMKKIVINDRAEIRALAHYQMKYISNGNDEIKQPEAAYQELKNIYAYGDEGLQIDIQKVELVYQGQEKIQPAYRFFGETNQGTVFEKFIPAPHQSD